MDYYSATKRNGVLTHVTTNWMLSERSQTYTATYSVIPFIRNVQKREIQRQKGDWWCQGPGWGGAGMRTGFREAVQKCSKVGCGDDSEYTKKNPRLVQHVNDISIKLSYQKSG